jgi:AcrR family transcriptional regulator
MTIDDAPRPRARSVEARRNRDRLLAVAAAAFAEPEPVALEEIARRAGVGIGTLYRHFAQREALVEAVYEREAERLVDRARDLAASGSAPEGLRRWADDFMDWAATKHGMIDTLRAVVAAGAIAPGTMRRQLEEALTAFLEAGARRGELRAGLDPADVAALFAGILAVAGEPGQRDRAARMVDIVIAGLRPADAP